MLLVACSGFPIAVSRYLQEFRAVEIADTEIGIPGTGTMRRWQRESPEGFVFSVLAPAEIASSGFAVTGDNQRALKDILSFCKKLEARALVFRVPEEVALTRPVASELKKLLGAVAAGAPTLVLDAPHWDPKQRTKAAESIGGIAARDPSKSELAPTGELAYLVLPGPAGHRSRYDDDSLDRAASVCKRSSAELTLCVFRNIDMEANAKALVERVGAGGPPERAR